MTSGHMQIALDGPASAGKSTVAKIIANQFNYIYCDTGAMYRAVTWACLQKKVNLNDSSRVTAVAKQIKITFLPTETGQRVFVDGNEVTDAIRLPEVTNNVSTVAMIEAVRTEMVRQQRQIAGEHNIVMDGRDIGTTVLPNAQVKIFLIASVSERAKRRYTENIEKGISTPLAQLEKEIALRDQRDSTRSVSPLIKADDAVVVDTTGKSIEQVVVEIAQIIKENC